MRPVPDGFHTVTPFLNVERADEVIAFIQKALGGEERTRLVGTDGEILHAEVKIGNSIVMVTEAKHLPPMPGNLHLYVDDPDAVFAKAIAAGAKAIAPPRDMFWGDRHGRFVDPFGNQWSVAAHIEDVSLQEMERRARSHRFE